LTDKLGRSAVQLLQSTCILHLVFSGFIFDTRTLIIRILHYCDQWYNWCKILSLC